MDSKQVPYIPVNVEGVDLSVLRVGIVYTYWHAEIVEEMLRQCERELQQAGMPSECVLRVRVPGSFELPYGAVRLLELGCDAVICLGCIMKGETKHNEYIASAVAHALQKIAVEWRKPVVFGVITPDTPAQAQARTGKGAEAARTALALLTLKTETGWRFVL